MTKDYSNHKLVKIATLDYDVCVLALVALDHLKAEYQKDLNNCVDLQMDKESTYWLAQLSRIAVAYEQLFNSRADLVELAVAQ